METTGELKLKVRTFQFSPKLLNSYLKLGGDNAGSTSEYELNSLDQVADNAASGGGQVNENIVDHGQQSFHWKRTVRDLA